jgi:DNA-binding PadR family transcriptional regulator
MSAPAARSLTAFEHVLLGFIATEPRSGYGLKRAFNDTPAAVYRPSPGALYPALRRLVGGGLLTVQDVTPAGGRAQRLYQVTAAGRQANLEWLREPVNHDTISADLGLHLMRFVMMETLLSPGEVRAFLADFARANEGFIAGIRHYLDSPVSPSEPHARLALEHGVAVHRASLEWARSTQATLADSGSDPPAG